jgi:hypothetical protein
MKPKPTPSTEEVREIAIAYALECKSENRRPKLSDVAVLLGRHQRWLTTNPTPTNLRVRAIIMKAWHELGTAPAATPELKTDVWDGQKEPDAIPAEYPVGDDLYGILNHPGRLAMFCRLAESGGIESALRYAQQQHEAIYAPQPTAKSPA